MAPEGNPVFGIVQPINGITADLLFAAMAKRLKGPPPDELVQLRAALATNLRAHIAANPHMRGLPETAAAEKLGKLAGVGKNTILRTIATGADEDERGDLRLDTLVKLAAFFGVSAQELLKDHSKPHALASRRIARANKKIDQQARAEGSSSEVDRAPLQRSRRT